MYKIPYGSRIYTDTDGNEIMVFIKGDKALKSIQSFLKSYKGQFIYPFVANDVENKDRYIKLAKDFNYLAFDKTLFDSENLLDNFNTIRDQLLETLSNNMFTSWQKSNDVVAARIPSQAMQSFMSMSTVGYNEDPGNNVYVSHWQIWLQGSDFRQNWSHYNKSR